MEKRRFSRFGIVEKCFVDYDNCSTEVNLRDISLNGAMIEFDKAVHFRQRDGICLSFPLGHSDKYLRFNAEVVHINDNMAGLQFLETDLGTLVNLHDLLKARTDNSDQLKREFNFLTAG